MPSLYGRSVQFLLACLFFLLISTGCTTVKQDVAAVPGPSDTPATVVTQTPAPRATPLPAATEPAASGNPKWVDDLIAQWQSEPAGNPPRSIARTEYKGQTVYYVRAPCCDQYNLLYDAQGNVLCAPDGGFTGKGDGKCSDFGTQGKKMQVIWQDSR